MTKLGIIIANTGTPEVPVPEAVRAYLSEFLTDPRICPMNPLLWKLLLNAIILPRRSKASAEKYGAIWTDRGSPLNFYMDSLAKKLQASFQNDTASENDSPSQNEAPSLNDSPSQNDAASQNDSPSQNDAASQNDSPSQNEAPSLNDTTSQNNDAQSDVLVRHAMSYGTPSIASVMKELTEEGCEELVVVPMYPQSAYSTTKVVEDKARLAHSMLDRKPNIAILDGYSANDTYIKAISNSLKAAGITKNDIVLMAFHSIPMKDVNAGDTYVEQVDATARDIAETLGLEEDQWRVGYQCRFDNRKWVGPSTQKAISSFPKGYNQLFVITPNFSIDCLETLYDVDIELRQEYTADNDAEKGDFVYVPCLNDSNDHVAVLRSVVEGYL